jgi:predicted RNA methylase
MQSLLFFRSLQHSLGPHCARMPQCTLQLVAAAKLGARAVGIELDADLVRAAQHSIRSAGLQNRATVVQGDAGEADVSTATVITL